MAFEITTLNVNLINDKANLVFVDSDTGRIVNVADLPIVTPGNQPENKLADIARKAARQALEDALKLL